MRFGWLTAAAAAALVAPAAQAAPPSVRYTFNYEVDLSQLKATSGPGYDTFTPVSVTFSVRDLTFFKSADTRQYIPGNDGGPTCVASIGDCYFSQLWEGTPGADPAHVLDHDIILSSLIAGGSLYYPEFHLPVGSLTAFGTYKFYDQPGMISGSITLSPDVGVPEPATWALMIMGFGAIGGALRRQAGAKRAPA